MKHRLLLLSILLTLAHHLQAQTTTSSMTGTIVDTNGDPLIGANVVAVHEPSGTQYGVSTLEAGQFNIRNMRIGGPYTIYVTFIGYQQDELNGIFLELGGRYVHNVTLLDEGVALDEVVVLGQESDVMNNQRTGASTNVTSNLIKRLPSITRSTEDFTRLNPAAAGGSFAGRNDQFNNYSLDGAIFNNPFGLDAPTPGGQSGAQPIPLDAVDQISVEIAPFDITQSGFTGAGINLVTKSGTNDFHGSVYGYLSNSDMIGSKVDDIDIIDDNFRQVQTGASIGGPIVKNKAFFFVNIEMDDRSQLGSTWRADNGSNTGQTGVSRVLASDLDLISNLLAETYGYETGAYEGFDHETNNIKGIVKLDFNLSSNHKLTAKYNFLDAFQDKPAHPAALGRRGPDFQTLQFRNSGYRIKNVMHSGFVELKSFFGSKFSNKFQAGYTTFRDKRDPFSSPFPVVDIDRGGTPYIIAGHEPFSINNALDQDVYQLRNDFNIYSGKHTITLGAAFERFEFDNSFNLGAYGGLVFAPNIDINDAESFLTSSDFAEIVANARNTFESNNTSDSWALAETNVGQFSAYAQDEFNVNPKLSLTLGLRLDFPLYFNTADLIQENIDRKGGTITEGGTYAPEVTYYNEAGDPVQFDHTELPNNSPLINPRFGFNYDVKGDRTFQIRGGSGLFSGRMPFVWIGNQVANPDFFFYCITDPDFKFPQVWKTNLGIDREFGHGWIASTDIIYTKDLQAQIVQNYGLRLPGGQTEGPGARPFYRDEDRAQGPFGGATNAYVFSSVDEGYQFNASFELQRAWGNNFVKLGYNYLQSEDVSSVESEISSDAYERNPANITHTNTPEIGPSFFGNRHRVVGTASKRFIYGSDNQWATTLSAFFEYVEGGRFSYTYGGDINNDGSGLNDLIYIPTTSELEAMNFDESSGNSAAEQRAAFDAYINQDDYLSEHRGEFAERYGALSPWYNTWDIRLAQEYQLANDQALQLTIDVLNFGNLLNSSWGVRERATDTGLNQIIGASLDNSTGEVTYRFDPSLQETFQPDFGLSSRWRLQFGLRYTF